MNASTRNHGEITPSQSVATKLITQIRKALSFSLRIAFAIVFLAAVCLCWFALFVLFSPFLLLALFFGPKHSRTATTQISPQSETHTSANVDSEFIFDRRRDISKLFGCNTRNVEYRWNLFSSKLEELKKGQPNPRALDFGAGSLRDSYELARLDFCVTAVDLDESLLRRYAEFYEWKSVAHAPKLYAGPLDQLASQNGSENFNLAIAFDVIEHLEDPASYCRKINSLLANHGLLFTIVPNKSSIFERYFKHTLRKQRARGAVLKPGVPHLQFKSPSEWEQLFEENGFRIIDHQMAIGFFVNDCWNGLLGLPLRVFVTPVLTRLAQLLHFEFDATTFEEQFSPKWLMKYVDVVDNWTRRFLGHRFGWNLIVAEKRNGGSVVQPARP